MNRAQTSLPRTLEAEVPATFDEALAYDAIDHDSVNRQFVDDLLCDALPGHDILDVGTGTARIPLLLCQRDPRVRVMAVDLSCDMLDIARKNVEIAGLRDRVQLDRIDARQLPFPDAMFDVVMSNSLIHHLSDPEPALREMIRVLKPGGLIFVRDLFRPATLDAIEQLVEQHARHEPPEGQQLLRQSLHAALNLSEIRDIVGRILDATISVDITSDRHWTWQMHRP